MAKPSVCRLIIVLLCAVALLSGIEAEELPAADANVEARNDESVIELVKPQAPTKLSAMKASSPDMSIKPINIDEKMQGKPDKSVVKEPAPNHMAAAAAKPTVAKNEPVELLMNVAATKVEAADSENKPVEFVMNAEVLKQPGMARLARHLKSFHNYQVRHAQSRAANSIQDEYDDDEDGAIEAEERAIRRVKRIRRRRVNNNLRRTNQRRTVAQRLHNNNQRQPVRRPSIKKSTNRRRSNSRRGSKKKSSKTKGSNKKRGSGQKGNNKRRTKQKASKAKRTKKGRKSNHNENSARKQASQMIIFVDDGASVADAA